MKKIYSKPAILFEDFQMSTNIAGDCNIIINTASNNECGYLDARDPIGLPVFTSEVAGCKRHEADGGYNGVCYHVPTETSDLFNS